MKDRAVKIYSWFYYYGSLFRAILYAQYLCAYLLTAYLPIIIIAVFEKRDLSGIIVGILLYFMAVIEQINYFHIRLSYETVNGRLLVIEPLKKLITGTGKRSQLRKDIDPYLKD